jgi:hypothetical protein
MTQQTFERAAIGALIAFAVSVGALGLAGILLSLLQVAAEAATAVAAAVPAGIGISIAIRRGGK